jgi:hypothetical protein
MRQFLEYDSGFNFRGLRKTHATSGLFHDALHPSGSRSCFVRETLQEDRDAIILADKAGFYDAFRRRSISRKKNRRMPPTALLFSGHTQFSDTKTIKLGTGTSNLVAQAGIRCCSPRMRADVRSSGD